MREKNYYETLKAAILNQCKYGVGDANDEIIHLLRKTGAMKTTLSNGAIQGEVVPLIIALPMVRRTYAFRLKGEIPTHPGEFWSSSDSISLVSKDVYCSANNPDLTVTRMYFTSYVDSQKTKPLTRSNTYHARLLDVTTILHPSQTSQGVESDVTAIKIEIVEAFLVSVATTPTTCEKNDGTITVGGKGGTDRRRLKVCNSLTRARSPS